MLHFIFCVVHLKWFTREINSVDTLTSLVDSFILSDQEDSRCTWLTSVFFLEDGLF